MSERILVTGGAGYLGSILVPALLDAGHRVVVLDHFRYRQNSLAALCHNPRFDIVCGDVRVASVVAPLLRQADIVIPLAALVGAPLCDRDPVGARTTNRDAILMMLDGLGRDQLVVMPTTNSAYGSGDENHECTEASPLRPISLYAREKVEVEHALMDRPASISFRLATVFGMSPRMRLDLLVNDFVHRAVVDRAVVLFEAGFRRNYIHVRDVARAFLHGIENRERMVGQIYNVGLSEANLSKRELCAAIRKEIPAFTFVEAAVGKDPDQRDYVVSNAKIEATGYRTMVSLREGILELAKGCAMLSNSRYGNV
jgi:nucleoside-diphosphate-sugar epimerase